MAIQMRRGASTDYDASKMLAGEIAIFTDTDELVFKGTNSKKITPNEITNYNIGSADAVNIKTPGDLSAQVIKSGHTCVLRLVDGVVANASGAGWQTMFNIPVTPSAWVSNIILTGDGSPVLARVTTSGTFDIYAPVANKQYYGSIAFFV